MQGSRSDMASLPCILVIIYKTLLSRRFNFYLRANCRFHLPLIVTNWTARISLESFLFYDAMNIQLADMTFVFLPPCPTALYYGSCVPFSSLTVLLDLGSIKKRFHSMLFSCRVFYRTTTKKMWEAWPVKKEKMNFSHVVLTQLPDWLAGWLAGWLNLRTSFCVRHQYVSYIYSIRCVVTFVVGKIIWPPYCPCFTELLQPEQEAYPFLFGCHQHSSQEQSVETSASKLFSWCPSLERDRKQIVQVGCLYIV